MLVTGSTCIRPQVTAVPMSQYAVPLPPGFAVAPPSQAIPSMMATSIMPHMMVPAPAVPVVFDVWAAVAVHPALAVPTVASITDVPAAQATPAAPVALVAPAAPVMSAVLSWMGI
ncbi:testis-specific gene A8 protein-like [Macrobrachium rosenbergii]|uniref:testis-specific gene A8 protein-like n=1 Tax=Macrobrachium rosenbergii TaxID=79674 RepID=UPI0034D59719